MQYISEAVAFQLAQLRVNQLALATGDEFQILLGKTLNVGQGWVFFFNTSEFVQTGNPLSRLAGNGPIFVSNNGTVRELSSFLPWEEALKLVQT
jgi:Immunity protein 35